MTPPMDAYFQINEMHSGHPLLARSISLKTKQDKQVYRTS